jgi:hypothetical protein
MKSSQYDMWKFYGQVLDLQAQKPIWRLSTDDNQPSDGESLSAGEEISSFLRVLCAVASSSVLSL